jgi:aerobic-type carbon monoxide dehydrogenase small subunit (CoxS/CutS family)
MSAGTGVRHSEFNHSKDGQTHFLQIWIMPDRQGVEPGYEQKHFSDADKRGRLRLVASPDGRDGSVTVHADASLYAGLFNGDEKAELPLDVRRSTYVQVARGSLKVNGREHQVDADPDTPLLYVLREDIKLNAAKFGCGLGQCGSCTVIVDGKAVLSCVTPMVLLEGKQVTTLEGLGTIAEPAPIQRAFMEEQAAQCGYCINGMIMATAALVARNKRPTRTQIRSTLNANLCRCGTHMRIMRAVERAAALSVTRAGALAGMPRRHELGSP